MLGFIMVGFYNRIVDEIINGFEDEIWVSDFESDFITDFGNGFW
jgi:hypothetical protein